MAKGRVLSAIDGLPTPFFDFAIGVVCILLVVVKFSSPVPPAKAMTESVVPKAEMLIEMTWDDGSEDDADLYVRGPDGKVVFFQNRQVPWGFLDQDDLGTGNLIAMPDGSYQQVPARRETVTIRAIVPGEYMVNCHAYRKRSGANTVDHVKLVVTKLNPFREVTQAAANLDTQGQEVTLVNFVVAPDGSISNVFLAPQKLVGGGSP